MSFCEVIRKETDVYWEASFHHPFVKGIADGSLPMEKFKMYMMQDAHYLKHYTKVLAIAASKANRDEDIQYFIQTAQFIHEAELDMHRTTFDQLGVSEEDINVFEPAPATYNYISHMYNAAQNGDVAEAFAAMFPCPWLYQEIGQYYKYAKPGIGLYQQWLDLYSSNEMVHNIANQKKMMDRFAEEQPEKTAVFKSHFMKSCYYEWQFWEMPWTLQNWEKEVLRYANIY